jgi:hypothetical protein
MPRADILAAAYNGSVGFDAATWIIEARKDVIRAVRRWCSGGKVLMLGHVFFERAGLAQVQLY